MFRFIAKEPLSRSGNCLQRLSNRDVIWRQCLHSNIVLNT